jgi:DNA helicase II / ATP-dependent DNA helicase PcrA
MWGSRTEAIPSRFLSEIPEELMRDLSATTPVRRATVFDDERDGFAGRNSDFASGRAFGAGTAPPARSTGAELLGLQPGDAVIHDRFGRGTVTKVEGQGAHARAAVNFADYGVKQLVLAMTPLRRA